MGDERTINVNTEQTPDQVVQSRYPWLVAVNWMINKIGLPTGLVLFGVGVWTGHVPSPYLDIAHSLERHVQQTDQVIGQVNRMVELMEQRLSRQASTPPILYDDMAGFKGGSTPPLPNLAHRVGFPLLDHSSTPIPDHPTPSPLATTAHHPGLFP